MRRGQRLTFAAAVLAAGATFAVTACGSSSSATAGSSGTAGNSGTAGSTAKQPTKSPITIGTMSPSAGNPAATVTQVDAGLQAAARGINAAGGIQGHPVKILTCNTAFDPNQEAACARKAISAHVTAEVGEVSLLNPGISDMFKAAGIANIIPSLSSPSDYTNPINFPITDNAYKAAACGALAPQASGKTKVGVVSLNIPLGIEQAKLAGQAAQRNGDTFVGTVTFPQTATDMGPLVQQMRNKGANLVILNVQPGATTQFISTAVSQGLHWTYCMSDISVYYQNLVDLGSSVDSFYTGGALPPLEDASKYPLYQQFMSDMSAEVASGDKNASVAPTNSPSLALEPWLGMQIVKQVASKMTGPISNVTFLAALNKSTVSFGNLLPSINFAQPNPDKQFSRLIMDQVLLKKWSPADKRFDMVTNIKPTSAIKLLGNSPA